MTTPTDPAGHSYQPILVSAPTGLLLNLLGDLFTDPPWSGVHPFTPDQVRETRFASSRPRRGLTPATEIDSHDAHLARIAYLARNWRNDGSDPPQVEVTMTGDLIVLDGCHRICAAVVRGDPSVVVDVSGFLDTAETVFNTIIPSERTHFHGEVHPPAHTEGWSAPYRRPVPDRERPSGPEPGSGESGVRRRR